MAIFPETVYTALKYTLEGSAYLSYVDTVVIKKYKREALPDFDYYAIVISPAGAQPTLYPANQRYIINFIELYLLGKILNGDVAAVMADSPDTTPPNVGILPMYEDVFRTLYGNNLGGEIELLPHQNELDTPADFNLISGGDLDVFLMEGKVNYRPRGVRFVDLA